MALVSLVRHGKSARGFHEAVDPDLSGRGHGQARETAARLCAALTRRPVESSPLRRARQSAAPLAEVWHVPVEVAQALTEVPVPADMGEGRLHLRRAWLDDLLARKYGGLDAAIEKWREDLIAHILSLRTDTVLYTHFLNINAVVGHALGDTRVEVFRPDHGSETRVRVEAGRIVLEPGSPCPGGPPPPLASSPGPG
ncbi:MAG: histidine phosphatase family protein [Planctomycetes bacterium]|nr:histidine phosphatase family protein [Planctomycetota bacterium]